MMDAITVFFKIYEGKNYVKGKGHWVNDQGQIAFSLKVCFDFKLRTACWLNTKHDVRVKE